MVLLQFEEHSSENIGVIPTVKGKNDITIAVISRRQMYSLHFIMLYEEFYLFDVFIL